MSLVELLSCKLFHNRITWIHIFFFLGDEENRRLKVTIKFLGISVGKFEDIDDSKKTKKIVDYFGAGSSNKVKDNEKQGDENVKYINNNPKKSKEEKEYILHKFFQVSNKPQDDNSKTEQSLETKENNKEFVVQSTLQKQESFFEKFLKKNTVQFPGECHSSELNNDHEIIDPTTPVCDVVNCGEDSNDTEYSTSTINNEINKSIALFEEDPQDVDRICNIRKLLNSTIVTDEMETNTLELLKPKETNKIIEMQSPVIESKSVITVAINKLNNETINKNPDHIDTIECTECGKTININNFDTHADYHLALRLRDEEKQQIRLERKEKSVQKPVNQNEDSKRKKSAEPVTNKLETSSIASFLVKIDDSAPTEICSQCGKRVLLEKLTEHLDFHEARKLSRELNKKPAATEIAGNSVKRKRISSSPTKKRKVPCKSITSFFNR